VINQIQLIKRRCPWDVCLAIKQWLEELWHEHRDLAAAEVTESHISQLLHSLVHVAQFAIVGLERVAEGTYEQ